MIMNTCLISDGSPILAGIATGLVFGLPPLADWIFCFKIPVVIHENLTRHRCQGHAIRHGNDADGAIVLMSIVTRRRRGRISYERRAPMPLSFATRSVLLSLSSTTELGA